jgi:NAD(P)-dependent dehydrogenase (short-subunit alcohol dehydrogenase family)
MNLNDDFNLNGKNILLTGASSGLGKAIAITCSNAGANLALVGRNKDALELTKSQLKMGNHFSYIYDLSNGDSYDELFKNVKQDIGLLSGFVHSAGIEVTLPLKASSYKTYSNILDINTIAAFEISRFLLKKKYRAENVSIVFLSSIMSVVGSSTQIAYAASKGALVAGARSAAIEFAGNGARFNCISPGFVEGTPMSDELFKKLPVEAQEKLIANYPLGLGSPEDIGNACRFLLSNASKWITGTNMMIDGGFSAK